jgi:SAM-dependent methyltransferase
MNVHLDAGSPRGSALRALWRYVTRRWRPDTTPAPPRRPPVGLVRFGSLRRVQPIGRIFGSEWGQCIDRYYIEAFLARHATDIHGHVLEVADSAYTRQFGGAHVERADVLHVSPDHPGATITADLTQNAYILPSETFDCIIFTQTLQFIYDVRAALATLYRVLKPGGVLLATCHGISQIARWDMDHWGEYWRFTSLSARKLFTEVFPDTLVTVQAHGNVLAAVAFLHGLVSEELQPEELDYFDPDYEVLITIRAVKPASLTPPASG